MRNSKIGRGFILTGSLLAGIMLAALMLVAVPGRAAEPATPAGTPSRTQNPVIVTGDEHDPVDTFNIQSMTPFIYEDIRLGLLNTHYSLPGAEPYEVYHQAPEDYPNRRLGIVDIQLAYSRDGLNWSRPMDRSLRPDPRARGGGDLPGSRGGVHEFGRRRCGGRAASGASGSGPRAGE